jgi:hypothetical protein
MPIVFNGKDNRKRTLNDTIPECYLVSGPVEFIYFFIYSYVRTLFGPFLSPAHCPLPHLLPTPSLFPSFT